MKRIIADCVEKGYGEEVGKGPATKYSLTPQAQSLFQQHISEMSEAEYRKEMERLGIDLSWKSAQIEGNTYSLLETERLLKEKKRLQTERLKRRQ